jgi:5-methylcytosine-specific restriction endonuclease McrA
MRYRRKCLNAKGEECVECGSAEEIEVHHIDADRWNNRLENLVPLCHDCHMKVHNGADGYEHWTEQIKHHPPGGPVSEEKIGRDMSP